MKSKRPSGIAESRALADELPATRAALAAGKIGYQHARVVINQAWSVPGEARPAFEAEVLRAAGTLTASKLKYRARLLRERLHLETIRARHQKSVRGRAVFFEAEPDGMASLTLYDSAEKVAGAFEGVTLAALSLQCPEEERTLTQLKADVFAGIILDGVTPSGVGTGIRGAVNVTVPVLTLMVPVPRVQPVGGAVRHRPFPGLAVRRFDRARQPRASVPGVSCAEKRDRVAGAAPR